MPTALRTYLFTNLLGYGELLQTEGDRAAARLVHAYRGLVTGQLQRVRTATIQEVAGDTIYAAFRLPDDAIRAALAIVRDVRAYNERKPAPPIRIGIGVHAGQTVREGRDYIGSAVALASRLSHAAQPGQILVSDTVFGLVRTLEIAPMRDLGVWGPHGLGQIAHVHEVVPPEGQRSGPNLQDHVDRALLTILFTDIARSTDREVTLGDREWADLIQRHHALIRGELRRHQGREVDTAGDGFFATFEAPSRAIECALAIRDGIRTLGLELRLGIHVGEVEIMVGKVGGVAVTIASRTREAAQPGEVLVSQTSGIWSLEDRSSSARRVCARSRASQVDGVSTASQVGRKGRHRHADRHDADRLVLLGFNAARRLTPARGGGRTRKAHGSSIPPVDCREVSRVGPSRVESGRAASSSSLVTLKPRHRRHVLLNDHDPSLALLRQAAEHGAPSETAGPRPTLSTPVTTARGG